MARRIAVIAAGILVAFASFAAAAEEVYKIGSSVGLTGYAANGDRAWRDGLLMAADDLNARGGLLGRKIEIVVDDNHSEPQQAVIGYGRMMSSDKAEIFDSGCVSAGNFAAAAKVAREHIPMILCSILPQRAEERKWAFSILPPPRFELEARYRYLRDKTSIRKIGLLYDPTPYSLMMKELATKLAGDFGLSVVAAEPYQQDDSDLSIELGRINAAGAGAVVKIGQGGSVVTAAKNIEQLGLARMLLLASTDDGAVFKAAGEVLGERFLFVAPPVQVPESIADDATRQAIDVFLKEWRARYSDRDPWAGARAWDSMMLIAKAVEAAKSVAGPDVRDAFETLPPYQGAAAHFDFSPAQHVGIIHNPYGIGVVRDGKLVLAR